MKEGKQGIFSLHFLKAPCVTGQILRLADWAIVQFRPPGRTTDALGHTRFFQQKGKTNGKCKTNKQTSGPWLKCRAWMDTNMLIKLPVYTRSALHTLLSPLWGTFQSFHLISESFLAAESLKYSASWDPITPTATIQSRLNKYHLLTKVVQQKVINFWPKVKNNNDHNNPLVFRSSLFQREKSFIHHLKGKCVLFFTFSPS